MGEFKQLSEKLSLTASNARERKIPFPPLPNLLVLSSSGFGITTVIRLLAGLLQEERLFRFSGEEAFFEAALTEDEGSFDRLLARIRTAAGFYGRFRGVVGLELPDVSRLLAFGNTGRRLMEFVDIEQGRILFVFVLPLKTGKNAVTDFQRQFISRTPLEILRLPFPETDEIIGYIRRRLEYRHMTLTDGAVDSVRAAVNMLRKDSHFEGFQSLNNLIDVLIWRKLSQADGGDGVIRQDLLNSLLAENSLLSVIREEKQDDPGRSIGFYR